MILFFLRELLYAILLIFSSRRPDGAARILMYHSVGGSGPKAVSVKQFRLQMAYLKKYFRITPLLSLFDAGQDTTLASRVCITFDDGFADTYVHAAPILDELGIPATFFITAGYVGRDHPVFYGTEPCMSAGQLTDLVRRGHELGGHTVTHPKLAGLPEESVRAELSGSKAFLKIFIQSEAPAFAYPKGSYNSMVKKLVCEAGFACAVTVREGSCRFTDDRFALPRIAVDAGTGPMQFRGKLSSALYSYERIKKILCR